MAHSRDQIDAAIAQLQMQRALLGDETVEVALAALRARRAGLAETEAAQALRQVSVLFLDVVGSTALSQHLEPEDIQGVMDAALAAFTSLVDRHGGRVMQYAGDSVLAAFGTEEVHEDDAERAVLCGLALLREAQVQAAAVRARHGWAGFGIRVGISSGDVLLGGGVDGDGTIRGITVNMAARMEQTAPAGQLRISHDTWRLVRGLFEVEPQAPLQVKGRDEPVLSYLVRAALPAPQMPQRRGVQGRRTPLHGRGAEQAALAAALADARPGAGLVLLSVLAEAGLGKTRLLDEFLAGMAPGRVQLLRAAALERRRHRPYGMLRALLMAHLDLADADGDPAAAADWLARALPVLQDEASAAVLGQLVGLDFSHVPEVAALAADGRRLRERARHHAAQLLLPAGAEPLLLALDDLHWADEASLDLLDELLAARPERAVVVLALARPELLQRRPGWGARAAEHRTLHLAPLAQAEGQALAGSLLAPLAAGDITTPPLQALAARLADSAEGNPFFLEELVNMLIDQGVIEVQPGRWQLRDERLPALRLPPTLKGVLQARLSSLPAQARRTLQLASVAGPVFWDLALAALDTKAPQDLPALHESQFIEPQAQSRLDAAAEYAFRHHSVHQVAYDSVLRRVKRAAHAVLARWLGGRPDGAVLQDQIATHHEAAGERLPAALAWQRAAEAARQRFANADAREQARRALALLGDDEPGRRFELLLLLARVCDGMADRDGMAEATRAMGEAAEQQGDDAAQAAARATALSWQARWQMHFGDPQHGLALARASVQRAQGLAAQDRVRAEIELLHLLGRLGHNHELRERGLQALALAREAGDLHHAAVLHNQLGMAASDQGEFDAAIAHYEAALAGHRSLARPDNEGGTLANLAFAHLALGEFETARAQFTAAAVLCERVGQLQNLGIVEINLGIVALNLNDGEAAARWALRALERLLAAGDQWAEAAARRVAGQAASLLGRHHEAEQQLRTARETFEALQQPALALEVAAAEAVAALRRGQVEQARLCAEPVLQALAAGTSLEGTDEPLRVWYGAAQALQAAGDARASMLLAQARAELHRRANALADAAARERFLRAVPLHRALEEGQLDAP
jgi:predicted ATPase/class 3 adenylate cyclase